VFDALQAGTLEVWAHGWTFAGLQADEAVQQQSQGGQLCQCTGARTQIPAGNIGWTQGAAADPQLTLTAFPAAGTLTRAYGPELRRFIMACKENGRGPCSDEGLGAGSVVWNRAAQGVLALAVIPAAACVVKSTEDEPCTQLPRRVYGVTLLVCTLSLTCPSVAAIAGKVTGLAGAANTYKVIMYLSVQDGQWYIKPNPGAATTLAADGTFTINGWASYPVVRWSLRVCHTLCSVGHTLCSVGHTLCRACHTLCRVR